MTFLENHPVSEGVSEGLSKSLSEGLSKILSEGLSKSLSKSLSEGLSSGLSGGDRLGVRGFDTQLGVDSNSDLSRDFVGDLNRVVEDDTVSLRDNFCGDFSGSL